MNTGVCEQVYTNIHLLYRIQPSIPLKFADPLLFTDQRLSKQYLKTLFVRPENILRLCFEVSRLMPGEGAAHCEANDNQKLILQKQ
jgi:hypothetical protein